MNSNKKKKKKIATTEASDKRVTSSCYNAGLSIYSLLAPWYYYYYEQVGAHLMSANSIPRTFLLITCEPIKLFTRCRANAKICNPGPRHVGKYQGCTYSVFPSSRRRNYYDSLLFGLRDKVSKWEISLLAEIVEY